MSRTEKKIIFVLFMVSLILLISPVSSARPAVAIVFDDGWTSQIYKAFPILQANNQVGTAFIITGEVPGATGQPDEMEYMNLSQLNKLYAAGWDLSSHTVTHPDLTTLSSLNLTIELNASKAYLNNAGFTRGSMFLAYPYGDFNSNVISAVQSNGYVAARTVCGSDPSNMCYFDLTGYPRYNATSPDRYEMVTLMAYGTNSSYSIKRPPAYVINEINNTINSNGFLIITFHLIVDAAATTPEEYNTTDFKAISDYLKSRSADIDVVTLSQFFNGTPTPPPDTTPPTITITTPAATNYTEGNVVLASFTCSDAQSGVKSCTGTVPNGTAINLTGTGNKTFTVNASDNAGNTNSYTVQYTVVTAPLLLNVFVRGTDNGLWTQNLNGTTWSGWQNLGGSITNLDATSSGGNIYAFARGEDGGLWDIKRNGTSWNSWQSLGGSITDLESISPGNVYAFARGEDGGLWYRNWNGTSWSDWQSLGGYIVNITSAASGANNMNVFVRGGDEGLWYRNWNGTSWSDWQSLGGYITDIDATSSGNNITVFARGADGGLWYRNWNSTLWSDWQNLGGSITGLDSVSSGSNVYAFVRGGDNGLWYRNWNGTSWSDWQSLGGYITDLDAVSSGNNVYVFVRGGDNGLWYRNWNGTLWSDWQSLGGYITDLDAIS